MDAQEILEKLHAQIDEITHYCKKKTFQKSDLVKNITKDLTIILGQYEAKTNDSMTINRHLDQVTSRNTLFANEAVGKEHWIELYFLFHQAEGSCRALHAHHFKRN